MERWLLISNCHTEGLSRSFQMVNSTFQVTPVDWWTFHADKDGWAAKFNDYSRVVILPELETVEGVDWASAPNLTRIPPVWFSAYHPDCSYIFQNNEPVEGPIGSYHSLIALAAFEKGLSAKDAEALFCGQFYERVGYMDYWAPQRDRLVNTFAAYGYDISSAIRRWGRHGAWMHTMDHPKVEPVYDIARIVMSSLGIPDQGSRLIPEDNLTKGPSWPVYPEIGENVGVPGSLRFKLYGPYSHLGLDQLINDSYAVYEKSPTLPMPIGESRAAYNLILENIG